MRGSIVLLKDGVVDTFFMEKVIEWKEIFGEELNINFLINDIPDHDEEDPACCLQSIPKSSATVLHPSFSPEYSSMHIFQSYSDVEKLVYDDCHCPF